MVKRIFGITTIFPILFLVQGCSTDNTLKWHEADGYKWADLNIPASTRSGFKQLAKAETGITFSNSLTKEQIFENRVLLNGSGVAIGDVDSDGLADMYFCRLDGRNVLYKNLGNWQFQDVTDSAGVACTGQFSAGAVFADIDGDADLDLLVTAIGGPNACFLNDGTGKFIEMPNAAGFGSESGASTMALADIDTDGDLDLYIANYKKKSAKDIWDPGELVFESVVDRNDGNPRINPKFKDHFVLDIRDEWILYLETGEPDLLFLNDGEGHFEKVPFTDGRFLDENGNPITGLLDWGLMARFQDMDGDGDPDIYVCNDFESPDRIWINDGTGRFQAIPKFAIRHSSNSSMAVDFSDIDRDGNLDFLVMDMLSRHHQRRMTQNSTSVPLPHSIGEIDSRPQYMKNTLFLNCGDGTYAEIAQYSGIDASEWSWSNLFLDVDLDGYEDVLVATGHYYDAQDLDAMQQANSRIKYSAMAIQQSSMSPANKNRLNTIFLYPKLDLPNMAFRNRGNLTFEDVSTGWGFTEADISHGMALGDLDNDGDMDVVMNRLNAPAVVYRNESGASRIAVRLKGLSPNTQAIGAKIRILGGPVPQSKEVISGGTYLSGSDPMYVFSAEKAENLTIEIEWRNGNFTTLTDLKPNRIYEIHESDTNASNVISSEAKQSPAQPIELEALQPNNSPTDSGTIEPKSPPGRGKGGSSNHDLAKPFFEDASHLISHKHHEDPFDDFKKQPLLPNRLSQAGPGVAWFDFDADGDDDLVITSGKGGQFACFRSDGSEGFLQINDARIFPKSQHDQVAVLGLTNGDGSTSLLVGNSNLENTNPGDSFVQQYDFINRQPELGKQIPGNNSNMGPMAMADYDSDGDLDLFIGGRSVPARYPEPASSLLFLNEDGEFKLDALNNQVFERIGLVSGAVFSDLDADGDADLVLAVEWGAVMVFRNHEGRFSHATGELGLDDFHGWWQGVTTGDLNEDGRPDIIATNRGLNSKYQYRYNTEHPLQIFHADFDNNSYYDILEAYFDDQTRMLVPERNLLAMIRGIPSVRMRIPDNKIYSRSGVQAAVGPKLKDAGNLKANTLASMVFFNRGDRFEAVEMPFEAQLSPAFSANVADFDGDGHEDVFISQNFFASHAETPRSDAGRGLWLKGDGGGKLVSVPGQESGVKVYGEQRSAALSDYDRDGRIDLVVSQNAAETKLYHNIGAKPGLRIRLAGPKGNRYGVGATIRLVYEDGFGPAREVHLGSGYRSQNSMVQVMGMRDNVKTVWVRWPGGMVTESSIPAGAKEVVVNY